MEILRGNHEKIWSNLWNKPRMNWSKNENNIIMNLFQEVQKNSEGTFLQKSPEKISKEFPKEHPEESLEKFQDELLEKLSEECIETPRGTSGSAFEGTLRKSCWASGETTNRTSGETARGTAGENARVISKGIPGETTIRTSSETYGGTPSKTSGGTSSETFEVTPGETEGQTLRGFFPEEFSRKLMEKIQKIS